jgi:hypothetical protein
VRLGLSGRAARTAAAVRFSAAVGGSRHGTPGELRAGTDARAGRPA